MRLAPLNPPMAQWAGKRVWLIGASSGIGLACAQALAAAGAQVVVSARKVDGLTAWPGIYPVPMDVTDAASVQAATAQVMATVLQHPSLGGPLDLVV